MMYRHWSEEAIRKAEIQLRECQVGTWQEKIASALNEALAQAEREDQEARSQRLTEKLLELNQVTLDLS
jgi:hypothetical protein